MPEARDIEQKAAPVAAATAQTVASAREPELASRALARIQQCLEKAEDQRHKITASGALTKEPKISVIKSPPAVRSPKSKKSSCVIVSTFKSRPKSPKFWLRCTRPISLISSKHFLPMTV